MSACATTPVPSGDWTLAEIDGQAQAATVMQSLTFDSANQRVSGTGGCNRFMGGYTMEGATVTFGGLATTRKACLDRDVTNAEAKYLGILSENSFELTTVAGQLILTSASNRLVFNQ